MSGDDEKRGGSGGQGQQIEGLWGDSQARNVHDSKERNNLRGQQSSFTANVWEKIKNQAPRAD